MATDQKQEEGKEFVVKHGVFWYHEPSKEIMGDGQEHDVFIQKLAFTGQPVKLTRESDIARGLEHGAFYTDEELKALRKESPGALPEAPQTPPAGNRSISELDDDELVDWIMSTGEFDGQKKPTAEEVVAAAGNDPALAGRLLDAEERAGGDAARATVQQPLEKVIQAQA